MYMYRDDRWYLGGIMLDRCFGGCCWPAFEVTAIVPGTVSDDKIGLVNGSMNLLEARGKIVWHASMKFSTCEYFVTRIVK